MISMDFLLIGLVGLSSIFNNGINVVETRIISSKNNLQSYDYYDFFEPAEYDFTIDILTSGDGSRERDEDDADFGSFGLEDSTGPFHASPKIFVGNSQNDYDLIFGKNDDEYYEISGSGIRSENGYVADSLYSKKNVHSSFTKNTLNDITKQEIERNIPISNSYEITTQSYHSTISILENDEDKFEYSGGINIALNSDDNEIENSGSGNGIESGYDTNSSDLEITTRHFSNNIVIGSDDEDYQFLGSGVESGNEYDTGNGNGIEGAYDTKSSHLEITTRHFPNDIVIDSDDEDYQFPGSGVGSGDGYDSDSFYKEENVHKLFPFSSTENTPNYITNEEIERNISVSNSSEITKQGYHSTISILENDEDKINYSGGINIALNSDDNEIENSGSGNGIESGYATNNSDLEISTRHFSNNIVIGSDDEDYQFLGSGVESGDEFDTGNGNGIEGAYDTKSSDLEITTRHFPNDIVIDSDDEDYQFPGSGVGSIDYLYNASEGIFHLLYTTLSSVDTYEGDNYQNSGQEDTNYRRETPLSRISSLDIATQRYYSKNIAPNSDDEEIEYSGSENGSEVEHNTIFSDLEITTRYLSKNIVIGSDDEDYELLGNGVGSGDGYDIDSQYSEKNDYSLITLSSTKNTLNVIKSKEIKRNLSMSNLFEITTQSYHSKINILENDDEKFEYSGGSNWSEEKKDKDSLVSIPNYDDYNSNSNTSNVEVMNSSRFGVFDLTTRYFSKNVVTDSDDEDYEFSGSGEESGDGIDTNYLYNASKGIFHSPFTTFSSVDTYERDNYRNSGREDTNYRRKTLLYRISPLEIATQRYYSKNIAHNSDDEEFEYFTSGNGSGETYDIDSSSDHEITTRHFPKNIVASSDDEDYELSGGGEESGNIYDTDSPYTEKNVHSISTTVFTVNTVNDITNEEIEINLPISNSFEITTKSNHSLISILGNDDEKLEYSSSRNRSEDKNDTDSLVSTPNYDDYNSNNDTNNVEVMNLSRFGVFDLTTRYSSKNVVTNSDDEDYELSDSGEESGDGNITDFL